MLSVHLQAGGYGTRILDAVPHGVCLIDSDHRVVFANCALTDLIGCTGELILEKTLLDLIDERDRSRVAAWFTDPENHGALIASVRVRRCHGEPFYADIEIGSRIGGDENRIVSVTDITDRFKAQQAERRGRQLLETHFSRAPLAVIEWRLDRSARLWNPAAERIFGYTHEEVGSCDAFPLIVEEASTEVVDRVWAELLAQTGGESVINTNRTKDGRVIQCHWHNSPLTDEWGNVVGVASLVEDITESVKAQQALHRANERLEWVVNKLPVIIWAFDENFVPVLWNEQAERITGYTAEQIIGNPNIFELIYPEEEDRVTCMQGWAELDFGDYDEIERPVMCADGTVRRILWSNIAARCPMPGWRAWGIGIDVTDRHEVFVALRESEKRYRDIIENADLAGVIVDTQGYILFVNPYFVGLTGFKPDEIIGQHWRSIIGADEPVEGLLDAAHFRTRTESTLRTRADGVRTIVWSQSLLHSPGGDLAGVCALGMDVTDHRRVQAELAAYRDHLEQLVERRTAALAESQRRLEDAERLASMGRLAAGLSHDLGNMLLPVRCHLDTLANAPLDKPAREALDAVCTGVEFLEQLGEGLALLGGQPADIKSNCEAACDHFTISQWWRGVQSLLEHTVPDGVTLTTAIDPDLPEVCVPQHLLTRAVMNLLVNAGEALTRAGTTDGRIELAVSTEPGRIVLTVNDNGPGLSEEIARHAREPFYTTKTRTLSTGLGLSVVDGFARSVGGEFSIESKPSGGTTARLSLPSVTQSSPPRRGRRVSIGITDPRLASLCRELLGSMGCIVTDGGSGENAEFLIVTGSEAASLPYNGGQQTRLIVVDPGEGVVGLSRRLSAAMGNEKGV